MASNSSLGSTSFGGRLIFVDYLRGLAALSVTWFHLTNTYDADSPIRMSGHYGWLGVEVFFVISGFVIPYSMQKFSISTPRDYGIFVLRRATRVELPYLVSIFLVLGLSHLSALAPGFRVDPPSWSVAQLLLHIPYLIPFTEYAWFQPIYWTLGYEFAFYLMIGLLFGVVVNRPTSWQFLAAASILALTTSLKVIPPYWMLFVMGCAVYRRVAKLAHPFESPAVLLGTTAAMFLAGALVQGLVGALSAILIVAFCERSIPGRLGDVLLWLGTISFSLYLVHVPIGGRVVNLGRRFADGHIDELGLSLSALIISLIAASLFHRFVEAPSHVLARSFRKQETARSRELLGLDRQQRLERPSKP